MDKFEESLGRNIAIKASIIAKPRTPGNYQLAREQLARAGDKRLLDTLNTRDSTLAFETTKTQRPKTLVKPVM